MLKYELESPLEAEEAIETGSVFSSIRCCLTVLSYFDAPNQAHVIRIFSRLSISFT